MYINICLKISPNSVGNICFCWPSLEPTPLIKRTTYSHTRMKNILAPLGEDRHNKIDSFINWGDIF